MYIDEQLAQLNLIQIEKPPQTDCKTGFRRILRNHHLEAEGK